MGEGKRGMIWENGIEIRIISYMEQVASPGSMHDTGCLGLVHWDDPEDGMGREEGGGFRMGNTCTICYAFLARPPCSVAVRALVLNESN